MDAQLPAKLQEKVMEQSWGMVMNVDFNPKLTLFWDSFWPNKGKYDIFLKIWISQILASMDAQRPAKLHTKVI